MDQRKLKTPLGNPLKVSKKLKFTSLLLVDKCDSLLLVGRCDSQGKHKSRSKKLSCFPLI